MSEPSDVTQPQTSRLKSAHRDFFAHLLEMPRWHKTVLAISALLAAGGALGQLTSSTPKTTSTQVAAENSPPVNTGKFAADSPSQPPKVQRDDGAVRHTSPYMTRVGLSILIGFVVGWVSRTFLKLTAML